MKNKSFEEIVVMTLMEIFGERNLPVLIYHLGGYETLKEPKIFEEKLRELFKEGADIILNYMKNKMEGSK
ncbi:MAG: hypothetical protein NZ922_05685 [Candidatus Methanomethyliaceae archaeon]|nr:hypothetical protein [Candidatus Methanomethyliaceae archaeon]MDW7971346.1 hypothetical protein [Nitrososphaerota archaeon]